MKLWVLKELVVVLSDQMLVPENVGGFEHIEETKEYIRINGNF